MVDQATSESASITLSHPLKSNLSDVYINTFLESQNLSYLSSAWPTVIYLSVLMAAGVAGNSLVLLVYSRKVKSGVTRFYILAMAACDLATNCFSLPMQVLEIRFQYTFWSDWSCKMAWTLVGFLVLLTFFLLLAVAVDRQRVICRQLQHARLASSREHKAVALCVAFSLILSSPMFWMVGTQEVHFPNTNVTGVTFSYVGDSIFMIVYRVMNLFIFVVGFAGTCVSYGRIARHLWVHKKRQRTAIATFQRVSPNKNDVVQIEIQGDTSGNGAANTSTSGASATCIDTCLPEDADPSSTSNIQTNRSPDAEDQPAPSTDTSTEADEAVSNLEEDNNMAARRKLARLCSRLTAGRAGDRRINEAHFKSRSSSRGIRKIHNRTTLMLFVLTVVFFLNYIPHLLVMLMSAMLSQQAVIDLLGFNVFKVMRSSVFINSAINPLVYSLCSPQFRSNCRRLLGCRET